MPRTNSLRPAQRATVTTLLLAAAALPALAQTPSSPANGWQAGAVLDIAASNGELALGPRKRGLGLGHSDVTAHGPLGRHLAAQATIAAHSEGNKLEVELEEAFLQTRTLPAGLLARAGRFSSQLGYLNEQHPHADDFVQRPLLYRAFLGNHWYDDGLRLNWVAPTELYLRLGAEVFRGRQLVPEAVASRRPGAFVLSGRAGGDIGRDHSWQAGLSFLKNRREAAVEADAGGEEEGGGTAHEHHAHGAAFSGRRLWLADLTWKWAPQGDNRSQQVRVSWELARVSGINRFATAADRHHASYLSAVWRFAPSWEAGARIDTLRVREPHEDHFDTGRLREGALMLAYKPDHRQTLRVQLTGQRSPAGFDDAARRAVQLQYIVNFGAHAAHTF